MRSAGGGGQFGQNGQNLHENDKIGNFGSKQWGGGGGGWRWGGQAKFLGNGGDPPLGEALIVAANKQFLNLKLLVVYLILLDFLVKHLNHRQCKHFKF